MVHAVETMAFAHEVPWHGLGVNVAETVTIEEMQVAAGLNWEVHKRPLKVSIADAKVKGTDDEFVPRWDSAVDVPDQFALVRDTDHRVYDVVGSRWNPAQPKQVLEFFRGFVEAGGATLETAGSLHGGRVIWALADLKSSYRVGGSKDVVKNYLLLADSYQQGKSRIARLTPTRVVCANTMAMALSGTAQLEKRWSHAIEFDPEKAAESLGLVRDNAEQIAKDFNAIKKLKMNDLDVMTVLAPVYQDAPEDEAYPTFAQKLLKDSDLVAPVLEKVMIAYKDAPGADPGTGWGVLNAATYYADHVARRDQNGRLSSAWMGKEARRKEKVFATLRDMAS